MNNEEYLFSEYGKLIDAELMSRYTGSLYHTPADIQPTYDEFRDMFSKGQVLSKLWAISEFSNTGMKTAIDNVVIVGAWYGTLGLMLNNMYPEYNIKLLDIDKRCVLLLHNIANGMNNIKAITGDMYEYKYTEDLIINTSCEHIPNLADWLERVPTGTIVILQSNNHTGMSGHINCVNSVSEFKEQANLTNVMYANDFDLGVYTRYMIIGIV